MRLKLWIAARAGFRLDRALSYLEEKYFFLFQISGLQKKTIFRIFLVAPYMWGL